ncbi:MAG: cytochrome c [Planctomycetota bacterium]|nr:cytochrome c [Planctomycetota bacterium]
MALVQDGPYDSRTLTKVFAWTSFLLLLSIVWMVMADHSREWKTTQEEFREIEIMKRRAALTAAKDALKSQLVLSLKKKKVRGFFKLEGDKWVNTANEAEEKYRAGVVSKSTSLNGVISLRFNNGDASVEGPYEEKTEGEGDKAVKFWVNKDTTVKYPASTVAEAKELNGQYDLEIGQRKVKGQFENKGTEYVHKSTKTVYAMSEVITATSLEEHLKKAVEDGKKSVAKLSSVVESWNEKLAIELGLYQAADLEFKNVKSTKEAAASQYEHAHTHKAKDADEKLARYQELGSKETELDKLRLEIDQYRFHGAYQRDNKAFEGAESANAGNSFARGPFRGLKGDVVKIEGWGSLKIVGPNAEAIQEYVSLNFANSQPIWGRLVGSDSTSVDEVYLPVYGIQGIKFLLAALQREETHSAKMLKALVAERDRLAAALRKVDHTLANEFVWNRPLVDFINPTLKVKQTVVEDLKDDYFFAQIRKVDRCASCHLGIEKSNYDGFLVNIKGRGMIAVKDVADAAEGSTDKVVRHYDGKVETLSYKQIVDNEVKQIKQPFKSHPNVDLFVGSMSPHPQEKFGCTICHQGEGRSIDFFFSSHYPRDEKQKKEWEKEHHWHPRHHWEFPQVRTQYLESSCLQCHDNNRPVERAPKLNFGREVWERVSCYGCHKMKGFTEEKKKGPDLRNLATKLSEGWIHKWLENPANFRPKTNMPRFWFAADAEHAPEGQVKKDHAEIVAVTSYLMKQSKPKAFVSSSFKATNFASVKDFAAAKTSTIDAGAALFAEKGCVGCHRMDANTSVDEVRTYAPNEYGPNLFNIGQKTHYNWLFSWLKNPEHYWSDTNMPNLQLTDKEAHVLADYLAILGKSDEAMKAPSETEGLTAENDVVEELCRNFLNKDFSPHQTDKIIQGSAGKPVHFPEMKDPLDLSTPGGRLIYLGRQMVGRYGCFGCHNVSGMETRPGIGAELSNIGDKALDKVDWGHTTKEELPHLREDWMRFKVKNPRYPDEGKEKTLGYLDHSRMPRFNLTNAEREALATFLSGHTEKVIPDHYKYKPSVRKKKEIEGSYQIYRKNCKACHTLGVDEITVRKWNRPAGLTDDFKVDGKTVAEWAAVFDDADTVEEKMAAIPPLAKVKAFGRLNEVIGGLDEEDEGDIPLIKALSDATRVSGKSYGEWVTALDESEDMNERVASVKVFEDLGQYTVLREYLEGMDVEAETAPLRAALRASLKRLLVKAGYKESVVKGIVLLDNRFQTDSRTGAFKQGKTGPLHFPLFDGEGNALEVGGKALGATGVAVVQVYEDGGGKKAGENIFVSSALYADPTTFYSEIVKVKPGVVGSEAVIPESLRKAYPDDFAPEGSASRARYRGGMTVNPGAYARVAKKMGDITTLKTNARPDSTNAYATALVEARSYMAPHLIKEGEKVQVGWLRSFLSNPSIKIRPWLNMRMPNYGFDDVAAQKIAYFFSSVQEEVVVDGTKKALDEIKAQMTEDKKNGKIWNRFKIVAAIQDRLANVGPGAKEYYNFTIADGILNYSARGDVTILNTVEEKTDSYRDKQEIEHPYWYSEGHELFHAAQCLSCHLWDGRDPGGKVEAWAPDLARVRERIRPLWFKKWVDNPASIVPGTKMSQQFNKGFLDVFPKRMVKGPNGQMVEESFESWTDGQISAVKDWVYAGMKPTFEAYPKEAKSGDTIRVSSQLFALDSLEELYLTGPDGKTTKLTLFAPAAGKSPSATEFVKELSLGRASALSFRVTGGAGVYSVTTSEPGKKVVARDTSKAALNFQGRAKFTVK